MPEIHAFWTATILALAGTLAYPGAGFAQDGSEDEVTFRVVTYNVAAGRNAGVDEIAAVLDSLRPDVVALQEVASHWEDVSAGVDQADELGRLLSMEAFYAPIYVAEDRAGGIRSFGLAVLTPHAILHRENHRITRLSTQDEEPVPRPMPGFPEVVVSIDDAEVTIFNTHLDFRQDPVVRQRQVEDMLSIIGDADAPTLLLGDLNARPDAPEIQPLFVRFQDAWSGKDAPGFTGPVRNPDRRIDYVLFSQHCAVRNAFVHPARASDHFPVVADLTCTR